VWPLLKQLLPRRCQDHDRPGAAGRDDVLDQVQKRGLGPVHVFKHDDQRAIPCKGLQQPAGGPEHLRAAGCGGTEPDGCGDPVHHELGPIIGGEQPADLGPHIVGAVGLLDPCRLPNDLQERPEGDAIAIGKATALQHRRTLPDPIGERLQQPGLAHPG
jgi:hypothetical protein